MYTARRDTPWHNAAVRAFYVCLVDRHTRGMFAALVGDEILRICPRPVAAVSHDPERSSMLSIGLGCWCRATLGSKPWQLHLYDHLRWTAGYSLGLVLCYMSATFWLQR